MDFLATRINTSLEHVIRNDTMGKQHLIEQFSTNRNVKDPAYHILIILYSALIILGASGNALVVLAIIRNKQMRTARNMFIVNLAISGNILAFFIFSTLILAEYFFDLFLRFTFMLGYNASNAYRNSNKILSLWHECCVVQNDWNTSRDEHFR